MSIRSEPLVGLARPPRRALSREPDGLALSSRNVYLSAEERRVAPNLGRVLRSIAAALAQDPTAVAREVARGSAALQKAGLEVEYLEIREAETLTVTSKATTSSRVFAAVRLGMTRLIDNMPIAPAA
jgi:pantoate--beta-alanine ligase